MITSQNKSNSVQEIILTLIILPFNPLAAVIRWSSSISWGHKTFRIFSEFGRISQLNSAVGKFLTRRAFAP
jgi:hypothetical protein